MAKASSRKVARAAGIGGSRAYRRQTPWGYFGILALIVVLGVVGTVASRDRRISQINGAGNSQPAIGTTWHEGYAVYICKGFVEPAPKGPDPIKVPSAHDHGIETQQSGVILIAPDSKSVAGKNATLGKFASTVGMKLNAAEIQIPGGKLYQNGDSCDGQPGHVYVRQFSDTNDKIGTLYDGAKGDLPKLDPRNVPLADNALITIAFVPASDAKSIPPPPAKVYTAIGALQAQEQASSSSTSVPALSTPTTTPTTAKPATTTPSTASPTPAPPTTAKR